MSESSSASPQSATQGRRALFHIGRHPIVAVAAWLRTAEHDALTPPARVTLLAIAGAADVRGRAAVSLTEIERWTGLSRSSVAAMLGRLERASIVVRRRSLGGAGPAARTTYQLAPELLDGGAR
jgi:DNA-binding MarR family transcriptional regulator